MATMSDPPRVRTVYRDGRWHNEEDGHEGEHEDFATKAEAQAKGRDRARAANAEHIVYTMNGSVGERHSYRADSAEEDDRSRAESEISTDSASQATGHVPKRGVLTRALLAAVAGSVVILVLLTIYRKFWRPPASHTSWIPSRWAPTAQRARGVWRTVRSGK